jgi:hypothetical protein
MKFKTTPQFHVDGRHLRWIRRAVGLPEAIGDLDEASVANVTGLPLDIVRKRLKLPALKYVSLAGEEAFLCGGALTSWIGGLPISDYDFFFPDLEAAQRFHDKLVSGVMGEAELVGYQGTPDYKETFEKLANKKMAVAEINPLDILDENIRALNYAIKVGEHSYDKVQIVLVIRGDTPAEVIDTFDFTISMLGTDGKVLYFGKYTLTDLSRKRLRTHHIHHGLSTMRRMVKYAQRGFYACVGTMRDVAQGVLDSPSDQPISLD